MVEPMSKYGNIAKSVIRLIVSLTVLGVIVVILSSLPGIQTSLPESQISVAAIASMIIGLVVIALILRFAMELFKASYTIPSYSEFVVIISNLIVIAAIWIAYTLFYRIMSPIMHEYSWIYPLVFLGISAIPMVRVIIILLRNVGKWSDLVYDKISGRPEPSKTTLVNICSMCGKPVLQEDKYCRSCGSNLSEV